MGERDQASMKIGRRWWNRSEKYRSFAICDGFIAPMRVWHAESMGMPAK